MNYHMTQTTSGAASTGTTLDLPTFGWVVGRELGEPDHIVVPRCFVEGWLIPNAEWLNHDAGYKVVRVRDGAIVGGLGDGAVTHAASAWDRACAWFAEQVRDDPAADRVSAERILWDAGLDPGSYLVDAVEAMIDVRARSRIGVDA